MENFKIILSLLHILAIILMLVNALFCLYTAYKNYKNKDMLEFQYWAFLALFNNITLIGLY